MPIQKTRQALVPCQSTRQKKNKIKTSWGRDLDDAPSACVAHVNSIGEGKNVFRFDQTRPAPEKQKKTRNIRGKKQQQWE